MEGLWNKLSGSESAAIVDNMTTGVRIVLPPLQPEPRPWFLAAGHIPEPPVPFFGNRTTRLSSFWI